MYMPLSSEISLPYDFERIANGPKYPPKQKLLDGKWGIFFSFLN